MEALILTVFVSLVLSALGVLLFVWDVRQGGPDHHDRLALLPLEQADSKAPAAGAIHHNVGAVSTARRDEDNHP